jgi:uncharacterized protein (DUF4415 family)
MAKKKPLIDAHGEVRELTTSDFKRMKPFSALPKDEQAMLRKLGRPKSDKPKELVSVRLDADALAFLRSSGPGWQTRLNALLAAHVKRAGKAASGGKKPKI